jgi:transposase
MRTYYVGLDVHSKKSAFVIEDDGGKVIAQGEVVTTAEGFSQLQATYQLARGTRVALETGTVAFFVARQLGRLGFAPIVVDAHEVRLKAHLPRPTISMDI